MHTLTTQETRRSNEIDIKNAVLNDYHYLRKHAIYLFFNKQYWDAVDAIRTLLSGVPLSDYTKVDEIIKEIDKIESASHNLKDSYHEGIRSLGHFQHTYRNKAARIIFNSVLRKTTRILQDEGYLELPIRNSEYGTDIRREDFSKAEKM